MAEDAGAPGKKGAAGFKRFSLEEPPGEPPVGPDRATTQKMLLEKAEAHKNIGKTTEGDPKAPIVRNPASEVDLATVAVPVEHKEDDEAHVTPAKSKKVVRPKSATKPSTLKREDTTRFEKDRIDEVAIHEHALRGELMELERLVGLKNLKTDEGKNNIRFIDSRDQYGNTALMNACWKGHVDCAEYLMKSGGSKDLQNYYGWTAMMWAVSSSQVNAVRLLLSWDVNLRLTTPVDRAAIDFADHPDIREMLEGVLNKPVAMLTEAQAESAPRLLTR